jgi:hypothetical protein
MVLILAESQFPSREVPKSIRSLVSRGLEILWVQRDGRSSDHLWPAYKHFPECRIVSVDDDKFFPVDLIARLAHESEKRPNTIIGARGWEITSVEGSISFGDGWTRASLFTQSERLFMPPGNGSLYPPGSLPDIAGDFELMNKICPNADDVWFWAMARLAGTSSLCLGLPPHRPVWRQSMTPALAHLNPGAEEFKSVMGYFRMEESLLNDISNG